jgi:phosphonoacetaldehyde hydrolase
MIRAVIFDWAGTTVDYGSRAPVIAFLELFGSHGITLTAEEARGPMGTPKRDHIRALLSLRRVSEEWRGNMGRSPSEEDVESLYAEFGPLQTEVISHHCDVIPGTADTIAGLRRSGIRIGSTTGYARSMMRDLIAAAAREGFDPEVTVCGDEVPRGRPAPWMALKAAMLLDAFPVSHCVKVGDTIADIEEGQNGGMWTVGVTKTGNELGLSESETAALDAVDLRARLTRGTVRLKDAGADYVIEGIAELAGVLDEINARLDRLGEDPRGLDAMAG